MTDRNEQRYDWQEIAAFKGRKLYEHVTADDPEQIPWEQMTPGERLDWIEVAVNASGVVTQMGRVVGVLKGVYEELKGLNYAVRKMARGDDRPKNPGELE